MWLAVLAFVVGAVTFPSQAANINVAAGKVAVIPGNGECSLREAILNAEAGGTDPSGVDCTAGSPGSNTISLAAGTYTLPDSAVSDVTYGNSGLPAVNSTIEISGNGSTISGAGCGSGTKFRIFYVGPTGNLTLNNLTLQNGCADFGGTGAGGALFNRGTLSLFQATITNNQAAFSAGAIQNDGTLNLTQSTISNNNVPFGGGNGGAGGGIVNRGTMTVLQSTINGNSTTGAGGGVDTGGSATATFANTTVSGNMSVGTGGGMFFSAAPLATVVNSTVTNNSSDGLGGGGIWVNYGGTVALTNSIVARQVKSENCWFLGFGNMLGGAC